MMRFGWKDLNYLKKFENEFAKYHNRKYCLMTPSFKMSFFLTLEILGIRKKNEILIPELSNNDFNKEILNIGIKPKFAEIDINNCCLCPELLKKLISKKTKAVLCENFFGEIAKISEIKKICKKNNLHLIEDISDVIGLKNQSNKIGKHGDVSICNFSIDKVITSGEGGAILTDEKNLLKSKKSHREQNQ